jgi:deoxyinosine 3'endonuclease (endonuclease V)
MAGMSVILTHFGLFTVTATIGIKNRLQQADLPSNSKKMRAMSHILYKSSVSPTKHL